MIIDDCDIHRHYCYFDLSFLDNVYFVGFICLHLREVSCKKQLQKPLAAKTFSCKNLQLQKPSAAKTFSCKNLQLQKPSAAKTFSCKNLQLQKSSAAKIFSCKNLQLQKSSVPKFTSCKKNYHHIFSIEL